MKAASCSADRAAQMTISIDMPVLYVVYALRCCFIIIVYRSGAPEDKLMLCNIEEASLYYK